MRTMKRVTVRKTNVDNLSVVPNDDAPNTAETIDTTMCEAVENWFDEVLKTLHDEAYGIASQWWSRHHSNKATAPRSEWGSYGVRARIYKGGLDIHWYRLKKANVEAKPGSGKQTFMLTEHVRRGRKYQCSDNALSRALAWEQALFEELEPQFAKLRKQAADLNRARGAYRRYKRYYHKAPAEAE